MKWKEDGTGTRQDVASYLNGLAARIGSRSLSVDGQPATLPDGELEYTLKYDEDEGEAQLAFKVTWPTGS
ncbi:amphi-Trp domain-containing protein [Limnochorda pilosa]|uniref:Amphi-Trp domain-containing protein n=1 Tax=Limnochorda pilosa TaxID=1555112 RepID=A0A0K2SMN3_LIMPI|nr:amphi-Trp domain-containing protein [Limnochorda pilosa]BAS28388.1 hypothetical protein LIP_2558 [Limnochorda pilosa]